MNSRKYLCRRWRCVSASAARWLIGVVTTATFASVTSLALAAPEFSPLPDFDPPPAPIAPRPAGAESEAIVPSLQGIAVVGRVEDVKGAGIPGGVKGIDLNNAPPWLRGKSFAQLLARELGHPMTSKSLTLLQAAIVKYCRAHDH